MQKYNFTQKETWTQFIGKLTGMFGEKADKSEIPQTLPNPQPVTFGGIIPEVSYDGSQAVNIMLPTAEMMDEVVGTPVGEIISYMGNVAPKHYIACDGTVYNIADYPELAQHFATEFGSSNYFGGDGETTFAVPDLCGEFLRGTGTNSHANSGNGANVGVHQDETVLMGMCSGEALVYGEVSGVALSSANNADSVVDFRSSKVISGTTSSEYANTVGNITVRTTNTSVLYCIKYKSTHFIRVGEGNYSLEERRIGTWIDGKPLYEKTVKVTNCTQNYTHNIPYIDIGWVYTGFIDGANGLYFNSIPYWYFPTKMSYSMINLTKTQIQLAGGSFVTDMIGYFVLRYTKTTD